MMMLYLMIYSILMILYHPPWKNFIQKEEFIRLKSIPIGTFYNSQRRRSKAAKKRDLKKAIKYSSTKVLDSTLVDFVVRPKSRKRARTLVFAPQLNDSIPSQSLEFLETIPIPQPFENIV